MLITIVAAGTFAGCASIISGTTQEISFHSNPEGATVTVDGVALGKTPMRYPLKKSKHRSVAFELDGYKKLSLPLDSRLAGWFWGNIVFGGLVGSTTDGISGAANEYAPNQFMVTLQPLQANRMETETLKGPQLKAREYIIIAYRSIVTDLGRGKGEYLQSLYGALQIPKGDQPEALKKLRGLAEVYTDIPDFADHAVAFYMKSPAEAVTVGSDTVKKTWDDVKAGTPAEKYSVLVGMDYMSAQAALEPLNVSERKAIGEYIVKEKGSTSAMSWAFKMSPNLSPEEKSFIIWFLPKNSEYKPTGL